MYFTGFLKAKVIFFFSFFLVLSCSQTFSQTSFEGLTQEKIDKIEKMLRPVLKGEPVTEIPEENRQFLFLAEEIFSDSYELFFRHGEYLANELNDYTQAIPRLKKALELKPEDLDSLKLLATCHCALKQSADEVSCWETLRQIIGEKNDPELKELKENVFLQLERMASKNAMVMQQRQRFIIYTPASGEYSFIVDELTNERLEDIYNQVTGDLECIPAYRTSIIVLNPDKFEEIKPTSWAGGFAMTGKSMILPANRFERTHSNAIFTAKPTIIHEFTHNIIFIQGKGKCPTWLNEGLAGFAEHKNDTYHSFKPIAIVPENLMSIKELEEEFGKIRSLSKSAHERVSSAYMLAELYARYLIQNFTFAAPRTIINNIKNGQTEEEALFSVTKKSIPEFQKDFRDWVQELSQN